MFAYFFLRFSYEKRFSMTFLGLAMSVSRFRFNLLKKICGICKFGQFGELSRLDLSEWSKNLSDVLEKVEQIISPDIFRPIVGIFAVKHFFCQSKSNHKINASLAICKIFIFQRPCTTDEAAFGSKNVLENRIIRLRFQSHDQTRWHRTVEVLLSFHIFSRRLDAIIVLRDEISRFLDNRKRVVELWIEHVLVNSFMTKTCLQMKLLANWEKMLLVVETLLCMIYSVSEDNFCDGTWSNNISSYFKKF